MSKPTITHCSHAGGQCKDGGKDGRCTCHCHHVAEVGLVLLMTIGMVACGSCRRREKVATMENEGDVVIGLVVGDEAIVVVTRGNKEVVVNAKELS